jgi:hypothetical protein
MKINLITLCFLFIFVLSTQAQIDGIWHTSFSVVGKSIRMDLEIRDSSGFKYLFLSDPDKPSRNPFQVYAEEVSDTVLSFKWEKGGLLYKGTLNAMKDSISGIMSQSGLDWTAVFTKSVQESIKINRPQEPVEPFPYQLEKVIIPNGEFKITGTLTIPTDSLNKNIIVVLASGSGPQNRDGEILGHKPFLVIADYLARNGIATLRFDDRGTGGSTAGYYQASLQDFANDVNSCIDFVSANARFADYKKGIAGHSEGGMHALIAANTNENIDFIIELASIGTSGKKVLLEQQYLIPLKSGLGEEHAKWNQSLFKGVCKIVKKEENIEKAADAINDFIDRRLENAPQKVKENAPPISIKMTMNMLLNNVWGREFLAYKTKIYCSPCRIPILAINGSEDIQVPAVSNNKAFQKWMRKSKVNASKALIIPGLNHLFQNCETCSIEEYATLEETFSEEVMQEMVEWLENLSL